VTTRKWFSSSPANAISVIRRPGEHPFLAERRPQLAGLRAELPLREVGVLVYWFGVNVTGLVGDYAG
jgi:hypothetical protein